MLSRFRLPALASRLALPLFALFAVLAAPPARAQVKPRQHADEPISVNLAVRSDSANYFEFYEVGTNPADGLPLMPRYIGGVGQGSWSRPGPMGCTVTPGKMYVLHLAESSSTWLETEVQIKAPAGYQVFVNGQPRTTFIAAPIVGATDHYYAEVTILPADGMLFLKPGQASRPRVGDFLWAVGLGLSNDGQPAGVIQLRSGALSSAFDPSALLVTTLAGFIGTRSDGDGHIDQILAPQAFVNITGTTNNYTLDFYDPGAVTNRDVDADDQYPFSGTPFVSYNFANVSGNLQITESGATVSTWLLHDSNPGWTVTETSSARTVTAASTGVVSGQRTETVTIADGAGTAKKTSRIFRQMAYGLEEIVSETADPDGAALTTYYDYYDQSGDPAGSYGQLKDIRRPDGSWEKYTYFGDHVGTTWTNVERWGELKAVYRPWRDAPSSPDSATDTNCAATFYDYGSQFGGFYTVAASVETKLLGETTGKTLYNPDFSASTTTFDTTNRPYPTSVHTDTVQTYTASGSVVTSVRKSYASNVTNVAENYAGRLLVQENSDGSKMSGFFARGGFLRATNVFTPAYAGSQWGQTYYNGWTTQVDGSAVQLTHIGSIPVDPVWLVPNRSTRSFEVPYDPSSTGYYIDKSVQIFTGGDPTSDGNWQTIDYSYVHVLVDHVIDTTYANGAYDAHAWTLDTKLSDSNADGSSISYTYDVLNRLTRSAKAGVPGTGSYPAQGALYSHYKYDAAGHVIWQRTSSSSDPAADGPTVTSTYDLAGRLTSSTDATGLVTYCTYANGGRTVTTTFPGGGTRIADAYLDGTLKSVTGTAVSAEYHATTVNSGGTLTSTTYALRASDLGSPTSAPRWASVTTDWAGRKMSESRPAPGGTFTRSYYYDAAGRPVKASEPGLADSLTAYDAFGSPYRSGLDLDGDGVLTAASNDRFTESDVTFAAVSGAWWRITTTLGFNQAGNATPFTSSTVKERLTGFSGTLRQETHGIDVFGNETVTTLNVDPSTKLTTATTDLPDSSTNQVAVTYNGLAVSQQSAQNLTTYYLYDSLGRASGQTDPRLGTGTMAYYDSSAAAGSRWQAASATDAAGNTTSYTYDAGTGRPFGTTNALGKTSYQSYTVKGQLARVWGQTTYPVEYGYDDYGEQVTQSTFRGGTGWDASAWPASPGTADTTTWAYDAATGLLTSKTDAAGHAVSYTYNLRGQLATRTWARGTVATYGYSAVTAEQTGITYSDSTPALSYTYNRMGQTAAVTDVTGTRTFAYSTATTALTSETFPGYFDSRVLTRKYDASTSGALGRNIGFTLSGSGGSGTESDVAYGYDATGRFNQVGLPAPGASFAYSFTTGSNLVATIAEVTGGAWTETNSYEAHRNLLTGIDGQFGAAVIAQFAYVHDALGRRTSVADSGQIFARYVNAGLVTTYGYNDRSEVTAAQSYYGTNPADLSSPVAARGFAYAFDNIGSRTSSSVVGNGPGDVQTTSYTNNNLNQVTARTSPGSTNVTGLAPAAAAVTVNGAAAVRQGDYYYKNVAAGSTPAWQSLAIASSLGGSSTRYSYLAATPESYAYDLDGNVTDDGRWHYVWDAENRLVSMETSLTTSVLATGVPRQFLQFKYDYLGRRVRKTVSNWNGSAYVAAVDRKFIYNGWNLVGEYNAGSPSTLVNTYLWGLDLSGNLTDGGGVGGLLAIMDTASGTIHLPAYDANGNIHALVNRAVGTVTAAYEYSPFGETLRATGSYAAANAFRFSTKYTDAETQFIYYGYRYYSPTLGRWLGRDPLEETGGLHLYAFCGNNAVNSWDGLGQTQVIDQYGAIPDEGAYAEAHPELKQLDSADWYDAAKDIKYAFHEEADPANQTNNIYSISEELALIENPAQFGTTTPSLLAQITNTWNAFYPDDSFSESTPSASKKGSGTTTDPTTAKNNVTGGATANPAPSNTGSTPPPYLAAHGPGYMILLTAPNTISSQLSFINSNAQLLIRIGALGFASTTANADNNFNITDPDPDFIANGSGQTASEVIPILNGPLPAGSSPPPSSPPPSSPPPSSPPPLILGTPAPTGGVPIAPTTPVDLPIDLPFVDLPFIF